MSESRVLLLSLTCAFALSVGGCDRQSAAPAQPQEDAAQDQGGAQVDQLGGKIDRSLAGEEMPAGELIDPDGNTLSLAETRGTPVLLNLWATWCAPCVVEMPLLDQLAADLGDDVRVLTVSEDMKGAEVVVPFFDQRGFANLPRWMDPQNDLGFAFGGAALPLTVLYDAEGREVWRVVGGYDWASAEAREQVREGLSEQG